MVVASVSVIDVSQAFASQRIGRFHIALIAVCSAGCFPTGFNLLSTGYIAPQLTQGLALGPGALSPVFAASGLGNVLGTLTFGPIADSVGRRPVVLAAMLAGIPFVLWSAFTHSVATLSYAQFFSNFFLMGLLPVVLTLAGEFMPKHLKTTLVTCVWAGFILGTILSGLVVAALSERFGWPIVFFVDAGLLAAVWLLLLVALPESPIVLARRPEGRERLARLVRRAGAALAIDDATAFTAAGSEERGFPVSLLFRDGRAPLTLLLWTMSLANLTAMFFLNSWLPTVLYQAGIPGKAAVIVSALLNLGGLIGAFVIAELFDRISKNHFLVLAGAYVIGGACMSAIGAAGRVTWLAAVAVLLTGFFTNGVQSTANAVVTGLYPPAMRTTGGSWAIGIGQVGQIAGSLLGGALLALNWDPAHALSAMALWTLVAAACAACVGLFAMRDARVEG